MAYRNKSKKKELEPLLSAQTPRYLSTYPSLASVRSPIQNSTILPAIDHDVDDLQQKRPVARNFYDDFTTIDWSNDYLKQSSHLYNINENNKKKGLRGKLLKLYDDLQGWILITVIALIFSIIAYFIDIAESFLVDIKRGFCTTHYLSKESECCIASSLSKPETRTGHNYNINSINNDIFNQFSIHETCKDWKNWSEVFEDVETSFLNPSILEFAIYVLLTCCFAFVSVWITLNTKTENPLAHQNTNKIPEKSMIHVQNTLQVLEEEEDQDQDTEDYKENEDQRKAISKLQSKLHQALEYSRSNLSTTLPNPLNSIRKPRVFYTAYGSGVPEVKTILSGFVIRGFLGTKTLILKSIALVFAICSGLHLGKEGPYVHLATCVGNISCRLFKKFTENDLERRQILSAAASAGVSLAFGSPLGGVLFSIEEVSYYFPSSQLFKVFFCAILSSLFLKFLNPYGTGKIVLFEVAYTSDWRPIELIIFAFIGIIGGIYGALFCKFTVYWWPKHFRELKWIKNSAKNEVLLIALITGLLTYLNHYTRESVPELLYQLASPCHSRGDKYGYLCPSDYELLPSVIFDLFIAIFIKIGLTSITYGLKVPSGIYVPSMVIGAFFGRIVGTSLQYLQYKHPNFIFFNTCVNGDNGFCTDSGIYAMISAGAFMAGVTRMNITLATILFEITSSMNYVVPISVSILISNWIANIIEPKSIYELMIIKNDFPLLDNRNPPVFSEFTTLGDLLSVNSYTSLDPSPTPIKELPEFHEVIDITNSQYISVLKLNRSLRRLQERGMVDGGISLTKIDSEKNEIFVGIISAPELEFTLDKIAQICKEFLISPDKIFCKLTEDSPDIKNVNNYSEVSSINDHEAFDDEQQYYIENIGTKATTSSTPPYKYLSRANTRDQLFSNQPSITGTPIANELSKSLSKENSKIFNTINSKFTQKSTINNRMKTPLILNSNENENGDSNYDIITANEMINQLTDLTSLINKHPTFLDESTPITLVQMMFSKIGMRIIVCLHEGKFIGVLHKKVFIDYCNNESKRKINKD